MRSTYRHNEAELARLQAGYRAAWRCFSVAVQHWRILQAEETGNNLPLGAAETAARIAEEQYRQARNALADYLLENSYRKQDTLLVGSR